MAQSKTYVPAVPPPQNQTSAGTQPPPGPPVQPIPPDTSAAPAVPHHVDEPADAMNDYRQVTAGTQYVPAPKPPTLVEILPAEYQTTNPPLIYRLSTVDEPSRPEGRIAVSRTYRAKAFSCGIFYKPISRFLVEWKEQ